MVTDSSARGAALIIPFTLSLFNIIELKATHVYTRLSMSIV